MRLILTFLAIANLRWASAAYGRAEYLYLQGDEAIAEAERLKARSFDLMARCGHPRRR